MKIINAQASVLVENDPIKKSVMTLIELRRLKGLPSTPSTDVLRG